MTAEPRLLCRARALYPYTANDGSNLSFEQGDLIEVLAQLPSGWWDGLCNRSRGWFPSNYVEICHHYTNDSQDPTQSDGTTTLTTDPGAHNNDLYRPVSPHNDDTPAAQQLFDDEINPSITATSSPLPPDWSLERPKDDSSPYFYDKQTSGMAHVDSEDPLLLEDNTPDIEMTGSDHDMLLASNNPQNGLLDFVDDHPPPHSSDTPLTTTTTTTTTTLPNNDNDGTDEIDFGGDWMDNDENAPQLPACWTKRAVAQGGTCYYNMATHEVAWDINDITDFTRDAMARNSTFSTHSRPSEPPKPQPRSAARRTTLRRGSVISPHEPLTWKKISIHIALAVHNLNIAARNSITQSYESYASAIVDAIRLMLMASDTVDKDSIHLRTHTVLRAHHRTMMASLSKLILSSHASTYNPTDHISKMLSDSNDLLMATRNFITTGESIPIQVQHVDPHLESRTRHNSSTTTASLSTTSTSSSSAAASPSARPKYTLDGDLAENIELCGNNLCDYIDGMMNSINTYRHQIQAPPSADKRATITLDSSRSSLSALMFTQFRNFSEQSGQFLAIFDDVDYTDFQTSPELAELEKLRQKLYQDVGDLFCQLQLLTDENVALDNGAYIPMDNGGEIKATIEALCHCVDTLVFDPSIPRQSSEISIPELSLSGTLDNNNNNDDDALDDDDVDTGSYYTDAAGTTTGSFSSEYNSQLLDDATVKSELAESSETNTASFSSSNRLSTTTGRSSVSTLQRTTSMSPEQPRQSNAKLKKFFGDDIPVQMPQTPPSEHTNSVAGGPPSVAMEATTGDPSKEEERPWFLQYDYQPNEIVFNMEGSVKGGTLLALVIRLTLHDYLDMNFINTFLLTYRSFCSSMELLKLLERRYVRPPPDGLTDQEMELWKNKKLKLIRLRVFNVLKNWLEQYYNEDDHVILDELLHFTTTTIRTTLRFSAEQLERLIRKRQEATGDGLKKMVLTLPTAPPMPILPRNRKKFRLLDIDPLEVARQMTIMDFKLYSSIRPVECLNKAWSKEDEAHVAVNIRASIEYCNQVTSWVSDAILSQLEVKKRVTLIKHWVQIAERCRQLNNFNTCMAILSAFDNSAVGRLKRTWEMVGARTNQILSHIRKLMGANRNFIEYRAIIHSINPPCIPFLGIYLQDLTFIEDGNADYLKTSKGLINFAKRAKTAEVIREIQQYQSTYYQLTPVDELQTFIQTNLQSTRDEEQLYHESLKLEPREREDEKITRLLQESGFL
ncbi:hypothetical protein [Absidia glauca]|uniref:Ras GEF n=1 Tax=Absidia glauca TaxID=4829 RepID=A0A168SQB5_ABSGL|nr:hypothetical protein [Absidia glauca]